MTKNGILHQMCIYFVAIGITCVALVSFAMAVGV